MNRNTLRANIGTLAIAGLFSLSSCRPEDPIVVPALTDYCGDVTVPTTWTNNRDGVDYRVGCIFTVTSAMVIEEGTEIEFKDGTGIIIADGGSLRVTGSAAKIVTMRGTTAGAGKWKGLWFVSGSDNNELTYCLISGGGQESFNGHDIKANIRLSLNAKLGINNTTVTSSARDGLYVEGFDSDFANPLRTFSNNTFSNNGNLPISTIAPTVSKLDGTSSVYTANGNNHIEVRGGNVYGNHTWMKNSIPFLVTGEIFSGYDMNPGYLTINAGVVMKFINDFGIETGAHSMGYIKMTGTASEHISLMSGNGAPWKGVCFQTTNAQNLLSYVDIDKGGLSSFTGATTKKGNVVIGGYSAGGATIENCNINNSAAYGIFRATGSNDPTITGVSYTGNTLANYYQEP